MTEFANRPNGESTRTIRVCHLSAIGMNVRVFFRGQFAYLQERGFDFTVITSEPTRDGLELPPEATYYSVPLARSITPWLDICSIWRLIRIFRSHRFDLVQYTTPKGALLGGIAAFLARVPVRLYLLYGLYYVGQPGLKRVFFKMLDWIACHVSTHVTFDGYDIRRFAVAEGLCSEQASSVVGNGSDNGIDLQEYAPSKLTSTGAEVRRQMDIPDHAVVIGSIMRLVGDKGINELVAAFEKVAAAHRDAYLLLVAEAEEKDCPMQVTLDCIANHPRIVITGFKRDVRPYYAAMDVFCLPTYREGFSAVNLEAAAMALPVVTTDAIGAMESIVDNETGIAVPVKDVEMLATALARLITNPALRQSMGRAGRRRVEEEFEQDAFWEAVRHHREHLLVEQGGFTYEKGRLVRVLGGCG